MFTGLDAVQTHPARRWTAVASFSLQAMLIGAMLIVPLFRPATLPDAFTLRRIFLPAPEGVQRAEANPHMNNAVPSSAPMLPPIVVRTGAAIRIATVGPNTNNTVAAPDIGPSGDSSSTIRSIIAEQHSQPVPKPPVIVRHVPPTSVMMEGNLLHRVEPRYPAIAVQIGIQGTVIIKALISREGTVEHPQVISGQAFLAAAAMDAVKEWRYRPYYLDGQAVEVETQITVNFVLNR